MTFDVGFELISFLCVTSECWSRVDLVVALDASQTAGYDGFQKMLDFVRQVTSLIDIGSGSCRLALLSYASTVNFWFHLGDYRDYSDVIDAISIDYT
jgi:von Willebrand factor type A domain